MRNCFYDAHKRLDDVEYEQVVLKMEIVIWREWPNAIKLAHFRSKMHGEGKPSETLIYRWVQISEECSRGNFSKKMFSLRNCYYQHDFVMRWQGWETYWSICKLYTKTWLQKRQKVKQWKTGISWARHKCSPVNRWGRTATNVIQGGKTKRDHPGTQH